jgi:hypothetical protein
MSDFETNPVGTAEALRLAEDDVRSLVEVANATVILVVSIAELLERIPVSAEFSAELLPVLQQFSAAVDEVPPVSQVATLQ